MAARAKSFSYGVRLERDWTGHSDGGGPPLPHTEAWSPEHLVLAGLARCTLTSLRYHARRAQIEESASAEAAATVTRREDDGRFAFTEISLSVDVSFDPTPTDMRELIAKAERDCFVGASLKPSPTYSWTVNGEEVR